MNVRGIYEVGIIGVYINLLTLFKEVNYVIVVLFISRRQLNFEGF